MNRINKQCCSNSISCVCGRGRGRGRAEIISTSKTIVLPSNIVNCKSLTLYHNIDKGLNYYKVEINNLINTTNAPTKNDDDDNSKIYICIKMLQLNTHG